MEARNITFPAEPAVSFRAAFPPGSGKAIMDKSAVLELAIETLERRKAAIDAEIAELQAQQKSGIPGGFASAARSMTLAQRAAQSKRMKAIWKQRKARTAKPVKKASAEKGPKSPAARKAQSLRMKAYWVKKKAEAKK